MPDPTHSTQSRDYRIFVGAFPTGELGRQIQQLRERVDGKTAAITAPHVTLAGTYWRTGPPTPENEAQTISALLVAAARIVSFDLWLEGIFTFPPREKPVIYLGVERSAGLLAARQALVQAIGPDKHRQFTPHLTLAMRLPARAAQAVIAELKSSQWETIRWVAPIDSVWLMQRGPLDPAWRPIAELPLRSGA